MADMNPDDVFNMTCEGLRKELKKKRLSVAGKKSILQFRLIEYIQAQKDGEQPLEEVHEEVEVMDTEEQANTTFTIEENASSQPEHGATPTLRDTIHEATPTNTVSLVLDEDSRRDLANEYGVDLHNYEVKSRPRAHRSSARKSLREIATTPKSIGRKSPRTPKPTLLNDVKSSDVKENRMSKESTPSRQKTPAKVFDRFADSHRKEMDKMESLGENRERVQKRHQTLTDNVPAAIRRLATPKSVKKREPIVKADDKKWLAQNPATMTFKFGENAVSDYAAVATTKTGTPRSAVVAKKATERPRRDVKELTKSAAASRPTRAVTVSAATPRKVRPATRVNDSSFTSFIATPKGVTPNRYPRRGGYTPFTGNKTFVDTTGLTDREYEMALEEGLIPGKSAKKRTNLEVRQAESKKKRDDIIALKRKLNVK